MSADRRIRIAIAGVGNCASSLLQGLEYYRTRDNQESAGVLHADLAGYRLEDVHPVAAFDVDARKVGRPLEEAAFAPPNCTTIFQEKLPAWGVSVQMGPILDGVAPHMADAPPERAFRPSDAEPVNVARALKESGAEVLVCYLPVGSERAIRHYAEACLEAGVAFVNCVPVFIASDPAWARRFTEKGDSVVIFVGHLGNFDLAAAWAAGSLAPVTTVAERLKPEEVFQEFVAFRNAIDMDIIPLTGGDDPFTSLVQTARAGGRLIALASDRDLTRNGVEVELVGHPARMAKGPRLRRARRKQCPTHGTTSRQATARRASRTDPEATPRSQADPAARRGCARPGESASRGAP